MRSSYEIAISRLTQISANLLAGQRDPPLQKQSKEKKSKNQSKQVTKGNRNWWWKYLPLPLASFACWQGVLLVAVVIG